MQLKLSRIAGALCALSMFVAVTVSMNFGAGVLRAQSSQSRESGSPFDAVRQANERLAAELKSGNANAMDTRSVLTARHAALEQIFRNSPGEARSYALDAETREGLIKANPSYAALLEREQRQTGELSLVVGDDFENQNSVMLYALHTMTGDISLRFTYETGPSEARMAHHQVTVSGLGLEDVIAAETIREASPKEVESCPAPAAGSLSKSSLGGISSEGAPLTASVIAPGAATAQCSAFGTQTTAILILNFTGGPSYPANTTYNTQAYWNTLFNGPGDPSMANMVKEASYGQTSPVADVYGPFTLPAVYDCTTTDGMATAAFTAATGTVDFTKYNRYILVYPVTTCNFGGLDTLPCVAATTTITHQYSVMWLPITANYTSTFPGALYAGVAHEYGHAMGLNHSNTLDFGALPLGPIDFVAANPGTVNGTGTATGQPPATTATIAPGTTNIGAINTEYGDVFANMGNPWSPAGPYAGQHKSQILGWIPTANAQVVTTSGNYSLTPTESNAGLRTLQVLRDPASSSWIWVEYHQPLGVYEPLSLAALGPNTYTTGAELHYQNGLGAPLYTFMVDTTATGTPNNFLTSNLVPGAKWSDPFSLLSITAGTQTAASMPVTISYDSPCATIVLSATQLPATAGTGTATVTAPSTCTWQANSNATWITFTGTTSGTGNGTVPFSYTANTGAQRSTYLTVQRQSTPVVQAGTGVSVMGLSPMSTTIAPSVQAAYTFTINDSAGAADFTQFNVTFVGGNNPDCTFAAVNNGTTNSIDIFQLANGIFAGPITSGGTGTLSSGSCTINGTGSSYSTNGNTVTITLCVSFPASFQGVHTINASASGATANSATLPVGFVNVAPVVAATPTVTLTPGFGNQGTTVPITITGLNTNFTAATTISLAGPGGTANGITVTGITAASATSLTASLVIPTTATAGQYTVTVATAAQTATTTFTVNVPPAPTVTLTPGSGNQGATVPITVTGINTSFTAATTVSLVGPGGTANGITVTGITAVSGTALTASLVIPTAATAGAYTVTVATGAQTATAPFTVNAVNAPSITISPASGNTGASVPVTITGTNTTFTAGSIIGVSGMGVTVSNVTFVSATSLTATFTIGGTATANMRTVTVTSGAEVDTTQFTVVASAAPSATIAPSSGSVGTTVPVTITGTNTSFSFATTVSSSSAGVTVSNVSARDTGYLTASLTIAANATAGPVTLTLTTGAQVVTTTFTVQSLTATTSTLSASATSVVPAQTVTLMAMVAPATGNTKPGGQVSFVDQNTSSPQPVTLGTVSLTSGTVSLPVTGLSLGTHSYTAQYLGDGVSFAPSTTAAPVVVTVAKAMPSVTLAGLPSTATSFPAGAAGLTLKATIGGGTTGVTPTGTVMFMDGATTLGAGSVTAGVATLTPVTLATGTHSITAQYMGDGNFLTLTSSAQSLVVQDFSLSVTNGSLNATGTESLSSFLTVTPGSGGFATAIALTCSGAPANSICVVTPATVTPGTSAGTATVSVVTYARTAAIVKAGLGLLWFSWIPCLLLLRRRRAVSALLVLVAMVAMGIATGCGTSATTAPPGTAAGTYTLTVTATATSGANTLTHTTNVTLTVN